MKNYSLSIEQQALAALPPELAGLIKRHCRVYSDSMSELVSESWLQLHRAGGKATFAEVFGKARSAIRRQTQDPAHHAIGMICEPENDDLEQEEEEERGGAKRDGEQEQCVALAQPRARRGSERRAAAEQVAVAHGVSLRRGQQLVKKQLRRASQGDLFGGGAT